MFWGKTQALDLLEEYEAIHTDLPDHVDILLVGCSDCRHVLKTIARKYRHKKVKVTFHVVESCMELIARQLMLLYVALQPQDALGLDQKTKIFMELYGNALIRPSVAKYLTSTASDLIQMVTDYDYMNRMMSCVSLDIKYKERDYMENLLKFWYSKDDFDICDSWERRLRKTLGARYDSRVGAFDWDLHMRFRNVGGRQVCNQEYRNFRTNGVAFSWLESEVSKPNRSLVCALIPNGVGFVHHGYLGDMQTGPFVAYGLDCEDEKYLHTSNGQNTYRATDVTERNLKQMFFEIQNQGEYRHQSTSDLKLGPVVMKQEKLVVDIKGLDFIPRSMKKCVDLEDDIRFASISRLEAMKYKETYFDLVYFGSAHLKYFDKDLVDKILRSDSLFLVEHELFVLDHRKKELEEFGDHVKGLIDGLDLTMLPFDPANDSYIKYTRKKQINP
ncbi:unnamed protein product [Phaedon cochleariae]|uniref:Dynein assembly factor 3, axonemal n=1 Tax=Phaedon cochleariae TaxID=80249 RepID=A0A9N9X265_PHACE|nr:unnamed protein product [Phaedon cochleariae]